MLLIFLGYQEEEISEKYSSELDWLKIRSLFVSEAFIAKMLDMNHRNAKPAAVHPSMRINRFNSEMLSFAESEINDFNLGLGRIFRWFQYYVRCRISDIQIRRELKDDAK